MTDVGFAVITGAASGIGRAAARRLSGAGPLLLIDLSADGLALVAAELADAGVQVLTVVADVSDEEAVEAAVASLPPEAWVRALVNSAGVFEHHPAADMPTTAWRRVLGVNLDGTFFCCRAVFPRLRAGSVVINVGSLNAHLALPDRANYAASKGAVLTLTRCLAVEWADAGIRVVSVSPGIIDTPMNRDVSRRESELALDDGSEDDGLVVTADPEPAAYHRIPLHRLGTAEEVADVIAYLASPGASYVTGIDLQVDGGLVAFGAL